MGICIALAATAASCLQAEPAVVEIVVPAGTNDRLIAGETVEVLPRELTFRVGDTLRIRNEDSVLQEVGPYIVAPNAEFEVTYGMPGRYEGICPLAGGDTYVITITK